MNYYSIPFEDFTKLKNWEFTRVADAVELSRATAREVVTELKRATTEKRKLIVICPVGPIDYTYWAEAMNREKTDGSSLITVNMDEYLDATGKLVDTTHPLSFRGFMQRELFDRLRDSARVPEENIHFPLPENLAATTRLIEKQGGADLCFGGMGLTGHFAFNDPPEPGAPVSDEEVRNSRTRVVAIGRESQTQMCMGGTGGNWEIIPQSAVTLGMYELLMSKRIHLTFMRSWHAGVLRRALFGPVTGACPGSFVQEHHNVTVTISEIAAQLPLIQVAQRIAT